MSRDVEFLPVPRRRLSDELAERISASIAAGQLRHGDRLPAIADMARRFCVAPATVREALMRLEATRAVEIRQGAGVFVRAPAA